MEESVVRNVMIILSLATPLVAGLFALAARASAVQSGEPLPRRLRRNIWILAAAGPVNLALWLLLNGILAGTGFRSVMGYALAALVFLAGGVATGFFSRLLSRGARDGNEKDR